MDAHDYAMPELLTGGDERTVASTHDGHRCRAVDRLDEAAGCGRQMWTVLRQTADLLREQARSSSAAWTDTEWEAWQGVYASTLNLLAGPHGDNGYGAQEATVVRQNVRSGR